MKHNITQIAIDMDEVIVDLEQSVADVTNRPEFKTKLNSIQDYKKRMTYFFTDFDKAVEKNCFLKAKPLPFYFILKDTLIPYWKSLGVDVFLLSSSTGNKEYQDEIEKQKREWYSLNDLNVKLEITKGGAEKAKYAHHSCILVDDSASNITNFINAGGVGLLHTSIDTTINELKKVGLFPS